MCFISIYDVCLFSLNWIKADTLLKCLLLEKRKTGERGKERESRLSRFRYNQIPHMQAYKHFRNLTQLQEYENDHNTEHWIVYSWIHNEKDQVSYSHSCNCMYSRKDF